MRGLHPNRTRGRKARREGGGILTHPRDEQPIRSVPEHDETPFEDGVLTQLFAKWRRSEDFCEELAQPRMLRISEKLLGGRLLEHFAFRHEEDAGADFAGEPHLVRDDDHGHALVGDLFDEVEQRA